MKTLSRKQRLIIAALTIAAILVGVLLYQLMKAEPVETVRLSSRDVLASITVTGEIRARISVAVSSPMNVRIADIPVDEGDRVQQGQIVVALDQEELQDRLRESQARLNQAEAALRNLLQGDRPEVVRRFEAQVAERMADVAQAEADRASATARLQEAQREARRAERLSELEFISRQELEQAQTEEIAAAEEARRLQANVRAAQSRLAQAQQQLLESRRGPTQPEIDEARAERQAAAAQLQAIQSEIRDRYIRASSDGIVIERLQDPGEIAVPGQPILRIANPRTLEAVAFVEEPELPRISIGDQAITVLDAHPDRPIPGTVKEIGNRIDPETGTAEVTVSLNEDPPDIRMLPGMTADINIITDVLHNTLVIPASSVNRQNGATIVYALQRGRFTPREIRVRRISLENYQVIRGLQPGEIIARYADPELLKIRRAKPAGNGSTRPASERSP